MNGENWDIELVFQFYYFHYLFMLSGAERASEFPQNTKEGIASDLLKDSIKVIEKLSRLGAHQEITLSKCV